MEVVPRKVASLRNHQHLWQILAFELFRKIIHHLHRNNFADKRYYTKGIRIS